MLPVIPVLVGGAKLVVKGYVAYRGYKKARKMVGGVTRVVKRAK